MAESVTTWVGNIYNSLTVISEPYSKFHSGKKRRFVSCDCICGKRVYSILSSVVTGHTKSCGCISLIYKDKLKAKKMRSSFNAMHRRCNDISGTHAKYYKDNGVYVCERWQTFDNFYSDMEGTWQLGLELDRHPNQKGIYEPKNCRWATKKQQQRNKSSNTVNEGMVLEIRISKLLQSELAEKYNINQSTISKIKNNKRWAI